MASVCRSPPDRPSPVRFNSLRQQRERLEHRLLVPRARATDVATDDDVLLDGQRREDAPTLRHQRDAVERHDCEPASIAIETPSKRMSPRIGCTSPTIAFSSVDLPAPLAPMIDTVSASATCRSMPNSAWKSP